jgi:hypothetical protein
MNNIGERYFFLNLGHSVYTSVNYVCFKLLILMHAVALVPVGL